MGGFQSNPYGPIPYGNNPYGPPPSYQQGAYTPYPQNPIGYDPTRDVYDQFLNSRALSQGQGDAMIGQSEGAASEAQANMRGYQGLTNELYSPIWGGGGGYNPQEQAGILQQSGPYGPQTYMTSQDELNQQYLHPNEQQSIQGDPYQAFHLVDQGQRNLEAGAGDSATAQRAVPQSMEQAYSGITGNPELGLSGQYQSQAPMSDAEVAAARESGAAKAGNIYGNLSNQVRQNALASGTVNPLGVAGMQAQLGRQGAEESTQAAVEAELAARAQQRQAAQNVENTRLGAQQYQTGTKMAAARDVGQLQATTEQELAARRQQEGEYGMGLGSQVLGSAESQQQQRAADLANSRINSQRYADQTRYGQGAALNTAMSGRYGNIANVHQGVQQEGRQAAGPQGQQGFYGQQYQGDTRNALGAWQQQQQGTNAAEQGYAGWGSEQDRNGFGSNFEGNAGAQAARAVFGGTGGHAGGGDLYDSPDFSNPDPYGESRSRTTVLSPDGERSIDDSSAVLPLNENRETTDTGQPNPYWKFGAKIARQLGTHWGLKPTPKPGAATQPSDPWHPQNPYGTPGQDTSSVQSVLGTLPDNTGNPWLKAASGGLPGLITYGISDRGKSPDLAMDDTPARSEAYAAGGMMTPSYNMMNQGQARRRMQPQPQPQQGVPRGTPGSGSAYGYGTMGNGGAGAVGWGAPRGAAPPPSYGAAQSSGLYGPPQRQQPGAQSAYASGGMLVRRPSAIVRPDGNLSSAGEDGPELIVPSSVLGGGAVVPHGMGTGVRSPLNAVHHGLHAPNRPSGTPEQQASRTSNQKPGYRMGLRLPGHRSPAFV